MRGVSQAHFNWDYVSIKTPFPIRRQRWILENNWYEQHVIRLPGQIKYACLPIKRCPGLYTCSFSSPRINMRLPRVLHVETLHRVHRIHTHTHTYKYIHAYVRGTCESRTRRNQRTLIPLSRCRWNFNDAQNRKPIRLSPGFLLFSRGGFTPEQRNWLTTFPFIN